MLHNGIGNTYSTTTLITPISVHICGINVTRKSYSSSDFSSTGACATQVVAHSVFMEYSGTTITLGNRYTHCIIGIGY